MKIIQAELQKHIQDISIHFLGDCNSPDFLDKKQADEFADNCIYLVENLNFKPEEFGYVEPDTRAETESQADKENQSQAASVKDHDEDNEDLGPLFNSRTIHQFKRNLGYMGEIFVNDAPLATLSNSNTINEIKVAKKVMGMRMTEDMRSIAQFFMKQFPLDIDSIYYAKPEANLEYFKIKSTAVIGGVCKTANDILDKVLLANSFLDQFSKIFLVGELGIAAIHCLGMYSGKVERSDQSFHEYDKIKEFFIKLFENSVSKECELILPCDFVTAEKSSVAQIMGYKDGAKVEEVKSSMGDSKLTNSQAALG